MNWLLSAILATLAFGVYPVLGDKAGKIHGPHMNFVLDNVVFIIYSVIFLFLFRGDIQLITKKSLIYGLTMGIFSSAGFMLMLYAWQVAPQGKIPIIMAIIGFSTIVPSIIYNFMGTKLSIPEWFCVGGATFFISALCLLQKRV
jgi:uncharacterized membrane protein